MSIKSIIKNIFLRFTKPYIIFESYPDFTDNPRHVYDELVRRGYEKKYNLVWYIENDKVAYLTNGEPEYWNPQDRSTFKNKMRSFGYYDNAKTVIIGNRFIMPNPIKQCEKSFFLTHGSPIKDVRDYYTIPSEIDYCLISSEKLIEISSFAYNYDLNRIIPLGYPRNDDFNAPPLDIKKLLGSDAKKVIVWYPTYKQHQYGKKTGCEHAIPLLYDKENAIKLNDFLKKNNVLIVLKPHFAQDLSYLSMTDLSNIRFIDDDFYKKNNISQYIFLANSDALLTDYSSVYYDYTLCNKPIGAIWEDIEDFKKCPGLLPNYKFYYQGAVKIYTLNDLFAFISDVLQNVDSLKKEREEIRDYFNPYNDGKNTERVVNFIIEKANL